MKNMTTKQVVYRSTLLSAAIAVTITTAIPNFAFAQSGILEEVTVTAQRREESIQDVGIAISAFSGSQLEALGVEQSYDLANFTPGVHISGALAGQNTQFTIRGVTQIDFADIVESPNAVYLDEGYIAVAQAQTFAVFDIDRVEVLKGPQGTLFGRNATGGLIHYISKKPTFDETEGYIDVTYGQFDTDADADQYTVEAAVGGPLSDTVAGRVAFRYNKQDGYLNNLYPEGIAAGSPGSLPTAPGAGADLGDDDTFSGRGTLLFSPSEKTDITIAANYSTSDVATGPYQSKSTIAIFDGDPNAGGQLINVIDTPAGETRASIIAGTALDGGGAPADGATNFMVFPRPVAGGDFFGYLDPDGDDFNTSSDFAFDDHGETDTWGLNVNVKYDLDNGATLTSITDYKDYEKLLFIDVDGAPVNQVGNFAFVDATSFTQEIRLNGETENSRWVAGFFYLNVDTDAANGLKVGANSLGAPTPGTEVDIVTLSSLETDSYSLFGQYEYDLSEKLTLITGLRVIREEKDYSVNIGIGPGGDSFGFATSLPILDIRVEDDSSDTLWAGKIQLDWQANDDTLIYAGINRGVKAGSFNAPLLGAFGGPDSLPYDEEVLTSFEVGFKSTLNEGRTRLNGSAYYYDYKDYQSFLFVGVGGNVINADSDIYGAELDLQTSFADGFDAIFSVSAFEATVKDVLLSQGSTLPPRDVKPTYAPELQASAILRYEWAALGGLMHVRGDVSYSDEFFYNLRNFDADKFDSYVLTNAGIGWENNDASWEVDFKIKNLTDERAGLQGFDLATLCGCNETSFRAPRSYAISVKRSF